MIESMSDDLQDLLEAGRKLALECRHSFVDYEHLFVAMIATDCAAKKYLVEFDAAALKARLQSRFADDGVLGNDVILPFTVRLTRLIYHSEMIADKGNVSSTDSTHLLLALLSYNNEVSTLAKKKGLVFADVAAVEFSVPVQKFYPDVDYSGVKPYSKIGKLFLTETARKNRQDELYAPAYDMYEFEQFDECIRICRTAQSLIPLSEKFLVLMALSYLHKRDFKNAIVSFAALTDQFPGNAGHMGTLAYLYIETGNIEKSIAISRELLKENPQDAIVLNNFGFSLCKKKQWAEAVVYFEKSISADPLFAFPWDNLGFAKYRLGDTAEGLRLIEKSFELDRGNSFAYKYKGIIFMEQGNREEAMKNFQLALKYDYTKSFGDEVNELVKKLSQAVN